MNKTATILTIVGALIVLCGATWGVARTFYTKKEVDKKVYAATQVGMCAQIKIYLDGVRRDMWAIQDRYRNPDGSVRRMGANDARRYRDLLSQERTWEANQRKWGCRP